MVLALRIRQMDLNCQATYDVTSFYNEPRWTLGEGER